MTDFRDRRYDVLVSTSVIEVGIDVPNATVMLIEGADRFGLAQLHQFRGRVGRGGALSYCLLLAEEGSPDGEQRLETMVASDDGFLLAEKDLELRGPRRLHWHAPKRAAGDAMAGWGLRYPSARSRPARGGAHPRRGPGAIRARSPTAATAIRRFLGARRTGESSLKTTPPRLEDAAVSLRSCVWTGAACDTASVEVRAIST